MLNSEKEEFIRKLKELETATEQKKEENLGKIFQDILNATKAKFGVYSEVPKFTSPEECEIWLDDMGNMI